MKERTSHFHTDVFHGMVFVSVSDFGGISFWVGRTHFYCLYYIGSNDCMDVLICNNFFQPNNSKAYLIVEQKNKINCRAAENKINCREKFLKET